jgi:hypothetical protein
VIDISLAGNTAVVVSPDNMGASLPNQFETFVRVRPVTDNIAKTEDSVDLKLRSLLKHRFERRKISVDI